MFVRHAYQACVSVVAGFSPRRLKPATTNELTEIAKTGQSGLIELLGRAPQMKGHEEKIMKKGFTLIELLVVITILAILAGAALPYVQAYVEESRLAKAKSDLDEISRALVVYETREGEYPDSDVKLLAGRYLNKSPIDPWGSPFQVSNKSGSVFSRGPDRKDSTMVGGVLADDADNIIVPYQPPLALVNVKWIDRNQNGVFDSDNIPDQLQFNFSRKLTPTEVVMTNTNLNGWFRFSPDGGASGDITNWVQAYGGGLSTPDVLSNQKTVNISLLDTYNPATAVVIGKAYVVVSTPNVDGTANNGDELSDIDTIPNLCISSQKVVILPQQ